MEILYLYVAEHQVLPDANINFGGPYHFEYAAGTKTLGIKPNPFHIENFFNPKTDDGDIARITNITAIVGENGAGKSTLLNYMSELLPRGYHGLRKNLILACREEENIIIYYSDGLLEKPQKREGFEFRALKIKETRTNIQIPTGGPFAHVQEYPTINAFDNIDLIFFSNVFDNALVAGDIEGIENISTNYLTTNDHRKNRENYILSSQANVLEEHRYEEIRRQLELINNFDFKALDLFPLPEYLLITFKKELVWDHLTKEEQSRLEDSGYAELYRHFLKRYHLEVELSTVNSERFRVRLVVVAFLNFILEISTHYIRINPKFYVESNTDDSKEGFIITDIVNLLSARIYGDPNAKEDVAYDLFKTKLDGVLEFIDGVEKLKIADEHIGDSQASSFAWFIDNNDKEAAFLAFYRIYKKSFSLSPFLNFIWRNVSSGEKALFTIFSRFYSLVNTQVADNKKLKQNIFILLDEPDTYLHPDWQKRLVEILCTFLPAIYAKDEHGRKRNIQICFTSNNPLTISDLPHSNVVFLKKRKNNTSYVQDSLDDKKMTFAANIFSLFADSFFLKDGFTGSFARKKINAVIDDLNNPAILGDERKHEIKKIIQLIGEPLVRNKLAEMYQVKEQLDNNYENRLKRLENEVFKNDQNQKGQSE